MTSDAALVALRHSVPSDAEREPHDYPLDGLLPRVAFSPTDRREVAELLRAASEHDLVVVPLGSRTALTLGRPLDRYDVALDMRGIHRMVEYVPEDLTVTVEAGMPLGQLQETLGEHGQYLPVDPPPDDHVTVGGMLATARPGAWRGQAPGIRDAVIGLAVALPDGSLAKSGGRVVKNVSGYDMHRLHTGALGAFGVIVEASFKLAPLPAAAQSLALRCTSVAAAVRLAGELRDASLAMRALAVVAPRASAHAGLPNEPHVLIECAGVEAAVERSLADVRAAADRAGAAASDPGRTPWARLRALAGDEDATVVRMGAPPTALAEMLEAARAAGCLSWGYPGTGSVLGHAEHGLEAGALTALRAQAEERGGFLQVEAASAELRRRVDPFNLEERELIGRLRSQLDPKHTINRGRWMEGL